MDLRVARLRHVARRAKRLCNVRLLLAVADNRRIRWAETIQVVTVVRSYRKFIRTRIATPVEHVIASDYDTLS